MSRDFRDWTLRYFGISPTTCEVTIFLEQFYGTIFVIYGIQIVNQYIEIVEDQIAVFALLQPIARRASAHHEFHLPHTPL